MGWASVSPAGSARRGEPVATLEAPPEESPFLRQWRMARWRASPNAWPVAFLIVVPVLAFGVPAMTGHPPISFDNLLQNFPLRVLSGSLLRQGHLPLWNPTIWSGSPLLGGLNSGSFYPGTLLFGALPALLAWVLNIIGLYWAAGLGMYALLRQYSLRPLACVLAAVTYQFGGTMTGQLVHLGVVQGMSWMPLLVLAELRLSWALVGTGPAMAVAPGRRRGSPWPWATLTAVIVGLIFLTGEPRAMAEAEIVTPIVLVWLALQSYPERRVELKRRFIFVASSVGAIGWGVAIGAAQLLPGRSFILASTRANETANFFGLGSLRPSWTIMLLVQNILGGNEILNQPGFSATYNLPEVTGYVGLLPLVGFFALAVRSFGKRADPRARDWRLWLLLAPVGLVLAWGTFTPLGHVIALIPFYNKVRLDSRSLGILDLGLAVLFGFWLELFMSGQWRARVAGRARWLREVAAPAAAPAAALAAALVTFAFPGTVLSVLGAHPIDSGGERVWMAAQAAVALGALWVGARWRHWSPLRARQLVTAVVAADLGLFALTCSTGMFAGGLPQPSRAQSAAIVGTTGRFAIVGSPNIAVLSKISEPDLNGLTGLDSVQGYGSIVSNSYDIATGTHLRSSMDPCALARGVFVPLRLSIVFVLPVSLITELPTPPAPPVAPQPAARCRGAPSPGTSAARVFYFGETLELSSVRLHLSNPRGVPPRVGMRSVSGETTFPQERLVPLAKGWLVRFAHPVAGVGMVVVGPARAVRDDSVVTTVAGTRYSLNGPFQDALGQSSWHLDGLWADYARFRTDRLAPRVAIVPTPGATVRRLSETAWGSETDLVDTPRAATVVRSEAYLAGWSVQARPIDGGPTRTLAVFPVGLVQGVRVPPGHWRITFSYWPSGLTLGAVASAIGVVAVVGVCAALLLRRRRDRAGAVAGTVR